ncbi:MAG: flagellar basal body-associated FliL family protein [Lachnospiraceae bacterium]|nr:flagellar basal body-associated FliL family protein [Lachnospiraceae bacterium]
MKKNLISVVILALVVANLVLSAIIMITILPQTKKVNELITEVCSAIDLELSSGTINTTNISVPIDQIATYDITEAQTIKLKKGEDGQDHYAVITVTISMNTSNADYKTYGEAMGDRESLIKSQITDVVSGFTYEEFTADQKAVQDAILSALQTMYNSDFIISVGFPTVTLQ